MIDKHWNITELLEPAGTIRLPVYHGTKWRVYPNNISDNRQIAAVGVVTMHNQALERLQVTNEEHVAIYYYGRLVFIKRIGAGNHGGKSSDKVKLQTRRGSERAPTRSHIGQKRQ
jgi:hypothetical protein